ncbi:glycosyltransferase [Streptomyces sp. NPDC001889]
MGHDRTTSDTRTPPRDRPWARHAGLAVTALAALQQVLLAAGAGGFLPGWQPWPLLLLGAPLLWLGRGGRLPSAHPGRRPLRAAGLPRGLPAAGVLALTAGVWAVLQDDEPWIGHEESVYANKARSWTEGGPPDAGWGVYRPIGLPLLGTLALRVDDSVGALRAVTLLLALFTMAVVLAVAARWTTPSTAVLTGLLLLSGLGFLRRVPEFLNDIGSTGLLLLIVFALTRAQERPGSRALFALPPLVLAAFHLRYGVVGNLAAIAFAALLAYGPRAWLAHGRRLALAGGAILLGILPHFLYATRLTGSPLGLLTRATSQAERAFIGDGLLYYLAILPYRLAGDLGGVVMFAGLAATAAAIRRLRGRRAVPDDRRTVFLGATSVLVPVVLGIATDGEPRFVYLPVILLTVLGVRAIRTAAGDLSRAVAAAVAALAVLTVLGTVQVVAHGAMPGPTEQARSTVPVARALAARDGEPCLLVTGYEPESGWYSGCDAVTYRQYRRMAGPPEGTRVSLIRYTRGRHQPGAEGIRRLVGDRRSETLRIPTEGSLGTATVVSFGGPPRPIRGQGTDGPST